MYEEFKKILLLNDVMYPITLILGALTAVSGRSANEAKRD